MIRDRLQFSSIGLLVLMLLLAIPTTIRAQQVSKPNPIKNEQSPKGMAKRQFRENVALPIDSNLLKRFGTAEELLADQRWAEAIAILQEIAQTENKGLVNVNKGAVGGVATYLNVATRCNILLSRVSAEGLQNYRQKIDPQAKRWYENWQRTRNDAELLRIVRQAFLSNYGDDALLGLGEAAWDRGDFSTARLWWEQLIPLPEDANPEDYPTVLRFPDATIDQPTILARIVLCSILDRQPARASDELRQFAERFPVSAGWLAGQKGRLCDLLQRVLDESHRWPVVKNAAEVETFGLSPSRFRMVPESLDVGTLRWFRPLLPNLLPHPVEGFPFQHEPLSYHPVVYEKLVLVNDADSIRAWNLLTGDPAWPSDSKDPATIYPTVPEEPSTIPDKMSIGVPQYTMTIANNRLYARMGSAVTCASNQQRDLTSDLVCLDLMQEGKLVWKTSAQELLRDDSWRFEGTPVVVTGRAYVTVCRRRPQLELMVLCLDASDGRLLWQRPVGGFRLSVDEIHNRVSHLLLTAGGGRIFLTSDAGAIIALDATDGRFEWAVSYETRSDESPAAASDPSQKGLLPAMFSNGLLFVAPNDADSAFCIEAESGRLRWQYSYLTSAPREVPDLFRRELATGQRRENQWRHMLGVAPGGSAGRLIASGNSLVSIDIESGRKVWELKSPALGRGVLAGDQILIPTRTTIEFVSQRTGERLRTIPLKTPDTAQQGGNLTIASGMLLVAQPNRLAAYCEYSQLKERIERELTLHPDNSNLVIQLGEVEAAEGERGAAEILFHRVLDRVGQDDPNYIIARQRLAKLWQDSGNNAFEKNDIVEARNNWLKSLAMIDDPVKRIETTFQLARAEESLEDPAAALAHFQSILGDGRLATVPVGLSSAADEATSQMSRMIDEYGRGAYHEIETAAAQQLDDIGPDAASGELQRFIHKYPHAAVTTKARRWLAESYRRRGDISEAYAILNDIRQDAADDRSFIQSTLSIIELLESVDVVDSTAPLRATLAGYDPATEVDFAGMAQTLGHVLTSPTKVPDVIPRSRPIGLERTWFYPLPADARVIVPENQPPFPKLASVLVCTKHDRIPNTWSWRCLDSQTGKIRWEDAAPGPVQVAAWTAVHLLIGSANGWQARTAENGRCVWDQCHLVDSIPQFSKQSNETGNDCGWPTSFQVDRGLLLFNPNDGRLISRIKPPGRLHGVFAVGSPSSLGIEPLALSAETAKVTPATIGSARGSQRDQSQVAIFQTTKPTRTWLASASSARSAWSFNEVSNGGEPWLGTPFGLENRIIGLTREQHLEGIDITDRGRDAMSSATTRAMADRESNAEIVEFLKGPNSPGDVLDLDSLSNEIFQRRPKSKRGADVKVRAKKPHQWVYRNFAMGQAAPFAWKQGKELLVLSDGSLLMSFDPVTGQRKWSLGLADFPLRSPHQQICMLNGTVFAASQGLLRGINVRGGGVRFERYLGDTSPQWQTSIAWKAEYNSVPNAGAANNDSARPHSALLALWPLGRPQRDRQTILFCDAESGEIIQRLRVDAEPRKLAIDRDGIGIVWTEKSLSGLRSLTY